MAPRKQYRGGNVGLVNIPNIQTPQYTAQADFYSSLNQRLDAINKFALAKGEESAIERATTSAINNPISSLDFMQMNDKERGEIVGTDKFTTYGKTTRAVGLGMLVNDLNSNGLLALETAKINADYNDSPENIYNNLSAISEGLPDVLKNIDPASYVSLKDSLDKKKNEIYLDYLKTYQKNIKTTKIVALGNFVNNVSIANKNELEDRKSLVDSSAISLGVSKEQLDALKKSLNLKLFEHYTEIGRDVLDLANSSEAEIDLISAIDAKDMSIFIKNLPEGGLYTEGMISAVYELENILKEATDEEIQTHLLDKLIKDKKDKDNIRKSKLDIKLKEDTTLTNIYSKLLLARNDGLLSKEEMDALGVTNMVELVDKINLTEDTIKETIDNPMDVIQKIQSDVSKYDSTNDFTTPGIVDEIKSIFSFTDVVSEGSLFEINDLIRKQGYVTKQELEDNGFVINKRNFPQDKIYINAKDMVALNEAAVTSSNKKVKGYNRVIADIIGNPALIASLAGINFDLKNSQDRIGLIKTLANSPSTKDSYALYALINNRLMTEIGKKGFTIDNFINDITPTIVQNHYFNNMQEPNTLLQETLGSSLFNATNYINTNEDAIVNNYGEKVFNKILTGNVLIAKKPDNSTPVLYDLNRIIKPHEDIKSVQDAILINRNLIISLSIDANSKGKFKAIEGISRGTHTTIIDNLKQIQANLKGQEAYFKRKGNM